MLVPSSLKIIELGAGSFALKSYLAENVGAAKAFEFIIKNKDTTILNEKL
jgi:tRNA A58 N-methylase Trm61